MVDTDRKLNACETNYPVLITVLGMNINGKTRLLLLVEPRSACSGEVRTWLTDRGLLTWWANDVSHAIEELSDFTVKDRPDVVMLEASPISDCLRELRTDLCGLFGATDVSVVAIGDTGRRSHREPFLATDFDQLETIINREAGSSIGVQFS
jgi:hypothetical protein